MDEAELTATQFERHRPQLNAVAYRMLGSLSEAEDAVQEAWLRLSRSDQAAIDNLAAWLTTVVGRVCIDMLRSRQAKPVDYMGTHLPDAIVSEDEHSDPEQEALLVDAVGLALLVVLETLSPQERLAFVLHDMLAVPFGEIAAILERSPEDARQLASRARRRVRGAAPPDDASADEQRSVVAAFLAASRAGDFDALIDVLAPEVVFRADAGALTRAVAPRISGAGDVARYSANQGPQFATLCHPALINGAPGLIIRTPNGPLGAVAFTVSAGRITTIDLILDPAKLGTVQDMR